MLLVKELIDRRAQRGLAYKFVTKFAENEKTPMKSLIRLRPFLALLLIGLHSPRSPAIEAAAPCKSPDSAKAILECALSNHPQVLVASKAFEQAKAGIDWAAQIPNPELSGTGNYGRSLGDTVISSQVSLMQPIYLGGVISSRREKARAEKDLSEMELLSSKETAALTTVSNLYRIDQISAEIEIIDETVSTFDKILKQFNSKVRLSPEQKASVNVFELAKSDFILRRSVILQEEQALGQFFEIAIGSGIEEVRGASPKMIVWPDASIDEVKSSAIQIPLARLRVAHAESGLAKSFSWPTLKLGPSISYSYQGGIQYPSYGVALSIDLPIFNWNGGHRSFARAGVLKSDVELDVARRTLDQRKRRVLAQYEVLKDSLSKASSMKHLQKKHHRLEKLFVQGLISPTLVIEAHRQMLDYAVNRNEREITARRLLWMAYILRGSFEREVP